MAVTDRVVLEDSWKRVLAPQFEKPYMNRLRQFLKTEKAARKVIYPKGREIFAALDLTPVAAVKVVIIGQDPYHGPGQAHGLCFSVRNGVAVPPSLANIFKEINSDMTDPRVPGGNPSGKLSNERGCLESWARQGVLLLNAVLTVQQRRAASHQGRGWEEFTDSVVAILNEQREHLVFLLWGSYAQRKGEQIERRRHLVLTAPHPSPLAAHRGFFGCRHFSKTNTYLTQHGATPIDWFDVQ